MPRQPLLKKSAQRIGEILIRRGWITNEELGRALDAQQRPSVKRVGEILKGLGLVSEGQLAQALAEQYQLEYIDLECLAAGWRIDRDLYTFKWKHLRMLPMRDPEDRSWLLVTEATADEKVLLQVDDAVDFSRIKFGVACTSVLEQVMWEHPATNELEVPPVAQRLEMPSRSDETDGENPREAVPGLAVVDVPRLLEIVGALWGQCAEELQRNAVLSIATGPRFRIEVRQIVQDSVGELPPGYVAQITSRLGRNFDVRVTVPRSTVSGVPPEPAWPAVWPPPDLVESVTPLLESACKVPAALRSTPDSLRWMGSRSIARESLNHHLIATAGISLGHARIDDVPELWAAVRARIRALDANQGVRKAWDRWKAVSAPQLEILPGHLLAFTCLATGILPKRLAPELAIRIEPGQQFFLELWKSKDAADDDPAGLTLRVGCPASDPA